MLLKPDVGDAELITAVRGGDLSAYGTLFERHVEAARRLARQLTNTSDADDLVSDAFAKVLRVLQNGGGPDLAFRAYLLTAVRRLHVDKIRAGAKVHTTDDLEKFDPGVPFRDTAVEGFENSAAAAAFASLPERWQLVLWHTEVEGQKPADVAELLGMSANSVSALAYRAREGLRQAFLNSHIQELDDTDCRWTHDHLGAYVRNGVSKRDGHKVEEHLDGCRKCMAIYLELTEVNSNLSGILAPIVLGAAAAGYLASGATVVKAGFLLTAVGRARDGITSNVPLSAAVGVAAVSTVVGVSVAISLNQGGGGRNAGAEPPNAPVASSTTGQTESQDTDPTSPDGNDPARRAGETSSLNPSATTDATATDAAASETADATDQPSDGATDPGGSGDTDGPGDPGTDPGDPGGPVGNPPVTQPEFDYDVPQGQRTTTIPISRLVQDMDGDELSFVDASLQVPDHGDLDITSVTVPTRGTAAPARVEEALVYVPDRGWGGRELVTYRVTDGDHTVRGTFRIRTVNDPPVANNETRSTPFGEAITVDLLANDTDPDGDPLTLFSYEQQPAHGTVTRPVGLARLFAAASDEGVVTYTPDPGWAGPDTVSYVVDDGAHQSTATLSVTTQAANRAPEPQPDFATTGAGQPVTVDVVANDTDPDGDPVALVSAEDGDHGEAEVVDGKLTYTPDAGWAGADTVTYVVTDGDLTAIGTLRVTTNAAPPSNHAPEPQNDAAETGAGQPVTVDVLANDTDPDGDDLTLVSTRGAQHGSADIVEGKVVYTPDDDWAGDDTVTYTVTDGEDTATGTLTVTTLEAPPVNRAPEPQPDFATTGAGQAVTVDVVANDTDPDGDPVALVSAEDGDHGEAEVVDGKLTYTPDDDWAGDDTIVYTVTDGTDTATGVLTVTTEEAPPANRAPEPQPDFATTGAGQPVTVDVAANDTDPDGDPVSLVSAEDGDHGDVTVTDGKLTYTPDDDWAGDDTVTYTVTDGEDTATGVLTVTTLEAPPVNRAPEPQPDFATTGAGQAVTVDVAANDTDPDGDPVSLVSAEDGAHGDVTVTDGKVTYTPDDDWAGDDTIVYTVTDGTDTATGVLTVTTEEAPPANRAPEPQPDFATTGAGQPVTVDVAANDTDPDGDPVSLVSAEDGTHGDVTVTDGKLTYTPDAGWAGDDTIVYTVTDGEDTATGLLTVTTLEAPPVNRAPEPQPDFATTGAGQPVIVDVTANDTDPDGDPVSLVSAEDGAHGEVEVVDGKVTYTPDAGWAGDDTVTYTVTDGEDTATGVLTVTTLEAPPVNRAPEPQPDFATTGAGQPVTVDVAANDTDPDGDPVSLVSAEDGTHGDVTVTDGKLTYTPDDDWAGDDTVTYTVTDGEDTATGLLTVTTNPSPPVNRAPVTVVDNALTDFETSVVVDVTENDTDPDGDPVSLVSAEDGAHGEAEVIDGNVSYTPDTGWFGSDNVTYTVTDGRGGESTGRLHVTTRPRPNRPPVAVDDETTVAASAAGTIRIDVLANDTDADIDDALSIDSVTGVDHGTVEIDGDDLVFTYDDDFAGNETFTYIVTDGELTNPATVTATVTNDDPVQETGNSDVQVAPGASVSIDILDNYQDPNGDALTLRQADVTAPARGTATVLADGRIEYTAREDASAGPDEFTYTVRDARGGATTARVGVTVTQPEQDLDLRVVIRDPGINQRFEVRALGATAQKPAELVVTWTGILPRDRVFAPDFCERTGAERLLTCLVTNGEEFDIRFQQLPVLFSLRMELTPLPPYVDPTPEVYTWSWL